MKENKREAVIFVPGVGGATESAGSVATRIADEFRRLSGKKIDVSVSPEVEIFYGSKLTARMATITPTAEDGMPDIPTIDVYYFDYCDILTKYEKSWNPLTKGWFLLLTVIMGCLTFLRALNPFSPRRGISSKDRFQLLYGLFILCLISVICVGTFYGLSTKVPGLLNNQLKDNELVNFFKDALAVLGVLGISSSAFGSTISTVTEKTVAMMHYLSVGNKKGAMTGPLEDLVKHVSDMEYDARRIVAYSFGSIVALDTLFPKGEDRTGRHFTTISTLVTIGCPFDVIRYYYPAYFNDRRPVISPATRWLNIYSPADVLGSNFRDDASESDAQVSIGSPSISLKPENKTYTDALGAEKFSWATALLFMGLRAHGMYWENVPCSEISCFRLILENIHKKEIRADKLS